MKTSTILFFSILIILFISIIISINFYTPHQANVKAGILDPIAKLFKCPDELKKTQTALASCQFDLANSKNKICTTNFTLTGSANGYNVILNNDNDKYSVLIERYITDNNRNTLIKQNFYLSETGNFYIYITKTDEKQQTQTFSICYDYSQGKSPFPQCHSFTFNTAIYTAGMNPSDFYIDPNSDKIILNVLGTTKDIFLNTTFYNIMGRSDKLYNYDGSLNSKFFGLKNIKVQQPITPIKVPFDIGSVPSYDSIKNDSTKNKDGLPVPILNKDKNKGDILTTPYNPVLNPKFFEYKNVNVTINGINVGYTKPINTDIKLDPIRGIKFYKTPPPSAPPANPPTPDENCRDQLNNIVQPFNINGNACPQSQDASLCKYVYNPANNCTRSEPKVGDAYCKSHTIGGDNIVVCDEWGKLYHGTIDTARNSIMFIFEGTDTDDFGDAFTDWFYNLTTLPIPSSIYGTLIHSGFWLKFHKWVPTICYYLKMSNAFSTPYKKIIFGGHSLGGAIAQLAAGYFKNRFGNDVDIEIFSFGAPCPFFLYTPPFILRMMHTRYVGYFRDECWANPNRVDPVADILSLSGYFHWSPEKPVRREKYAKFEVNTDSLGDFFAGIAGCAPNGGDYDEESAYIIPILGQALGVLEHSMDEYIDKINGIYCQGGRAP